MKYKKFIISLLTLFVVLIYYWLFLYRNVPDITNISSLLSITTLGSGYNYLILHGSFYSFVYFLLLCEIFTQLNVQFLVRKKRASYIKQLALQNIIMSTIFVSIFVLVQIILTMKSVDIKLLYRSNYFAGIILYWISLVILYILIGSIFILLDIIFMDQKVALLISFIFTTCLVYLQYKKYMNTPFESIIVFDYLLSQSGINIIEFLINNMKNIIFIISTLYCTKIIFSQKDILKNET